MKELSPITMQVALAKEALRCCEELNRSCGLSLSEADIEELVQLRGEALRATGRVEFGGGILPKLVRTFCRSPYVDNQNYAATLGDLQDAFYYFKNEAEDRFSDDDLLDYMERVFNGPAEGSTELLSAFSLEELCRWARNGGELGYDGEGLWDR